VLGGISIFWVGVGSESPRNELNLHLPPNRTLIVLQMIQVWGTLEPAESFKTQRKVGQILALGRP